MTWRTLCWIVVDVLIALNAVAVAQEQPGSLRGAVYDKDFDTPLAGVQVSIVENGLRTATTGQGHFVFAELPAGVYTVVFTKEGYVRHLRAGVVVSAGRLTDLEVRLAGEFTDMEEFVVEDLQIGVGSEAALLRLRFDSAALLDSIGADLMSRAGASDAASALKLVSGATVQDGKFAVIRGLPDRYVSSQMNGVRLPTADEDKRAVELDQFPAAIIESIRVSKTFMPDQQGDASGGAVDVRLKGVPTETFFQVSGQLSRNSQVEDADPFLGYEGGGVDTWGKSGSKKQMQVPGTDWTGAVGVSPEKRPNDYKLSTAAGGRIEGDNGVTIGGLASLFYERDSSFHDRGVDDSYWVTTPGGPLVPETIQGVPMPGGGGDYKTALFDVTEATQSVRWGGLGTLGLETDKHELGLTYLYTRVAEDKATLAQDTRGKEFFFPGYDPDDPMGIGNDKDSLTTAPYLRTETLEYTERTTSTLQLTGWHELPVPDFTLGSFTFRKPELDWVVADSSATLDQPDKRQFGALWHADSFDPGFPAFGIPPSTTPATWYPYKPEANFTLGNLQRIWKEIEEESSQTALNIKLPFEQWSGDEGYLKFGVFRDEVERSFDQDSFSNFNDGGATFVGEWDEPWSAAFPGEIHLITAATTDVDYEGEQEISAWYGMFDLPLGPRWTVLGGARFESTKLSIVNTPEADATWFPPGSLTAVKLNPGDADVSFEQDDTLPAVGVVFEPTEQLTLRGSFAKTVARQTFKELTPIIQQEYLGGPIFIGNPALGMSALDNYDLRADYVPAEGSLISASWFKKDIEDPIEYVQKPGDFTYTTAENYPKGELTGWEIEVREHLGRHWESLSGFSVGANATFIDSEVQLPAAEVAKFADPAILVPMSSRDMTNAPEHLYNLYLTYDIEHTGTQLSLFYTVTGDMLVEGAGVDPPNFIPNVYAKEYGTLNFSVSQKVGKRATVQLQVKNITDEKIEEVYRLPSGGDVTKTSYRKGRDFALSLSLRF